MQQVLETPITLEPRRVPEVMDLLEHGAKEEIFPGAVLLVGTPEQTLINTAVGMKAFKIGGDAEILPMTVDTVFDIASLTAGVVTTTLIMKLVESTQIKIQDRISRYIQGFGVFGKAPVTIAHLLSHTSGLPYWHPFFEDLVKQNSTSRLGILTSKGARDYVLASILRLPVKGEVGAKYLYSDLGAIILGFLIEVLTGNGLERALHRMIGQPLKLKSTSFIDLSRIRRRGIHPVTDLIAPTEECPWRKRVLCGEVHDDNAWAMGGIAGHSGLFSTARDLQLVSAELLRALDGTSDYLKRETVEQFLNGVELSNGTRVKHGWDTPNKENGLLDSGLSARAFGLNGFTGCSLWIDPETRLYIVLLSNRINPTRSNKKILTFRPELVRTVLRSLH